MGDGAVQSPLLIVALLVAAAAGVLAIWHTARNPLVGCALLVVAVPLTGGLGRGTLLPVFRLSEVLTMVVAGAILLNRVLDREHRPPFLRSLDVPVGALALGSALVPGFVLWASHANPSVDTWVRVAGPLQYLVVYAIFARSHLTEAQQRTVLNLAMGVSIVVAIIGLLQIADAPGVRSFLQTYYPRTGRVPGICEFGACRPTSVLQHWSAFGAFALMHFTLALALAATLRSGFSGRWLGLVVAVNGVAVFASQTQAAMIGLVVATAIVVVHRQRIPRVLAVGGVVAILGMALLWPQVSARLEHQLFASNQLAVPDSFQVRQRYWVDLFLPLAAEHAWFGTGTVIPTEVPTRLVRFVDSEYLGMMFRAGLVGVALLVSALMAIAIAAASTRSHPPLAQALGTALLADVLVLAAMGVTAEYITFGGVSQALWMTVGLFSTATLRPAPLQAWARPAPAAPLPARGGVA